MWLLEKVKVTYVAHVTFLLDSPVLDLSILGSRATGWSWAQSRIIVMP